MTDSKDIAELKQKVTELEFKLREFELKRDASLSSFESKSDNLKEDLIEFGETLMEHKNEEIIERKKLTDRVVSLDKGLTEQGNKNTLYQKDLDALNERIKKIEETSDSKNKEVRNIIINIVMLIAGSVISYLFSRIIGG